MTSVLVIAEVEHNKVALSTLPTLQAAQELSDEFDVLVMGCACKEAAEQLQVFAPIHKVYLADNEVYRNHIAENCVPLIHEISSKYHYILAPSTTFGKNIMPRLAATKDVMLISDVIKIVDPKTFQRPIYAGNAITTVETKDDPILLTIRATAFEKLEQGNNSAPIIPLDLKFNDDRVEFIKSEIIELSRPDLTSARIVISGGRGLQSSDNFKKLEILADKLGAAIGATRAAVDAGFVPNDYQVGQTGKIVAPDLYIAFGISGAIQHLAGMKESKIIVAINKDPEAPIFQIADYGWVTDLFTAISELENAL